MVFALFLLSLFLFFSFALFSLFFTFFLFLLISLSSFCISDGPFRWTPSGEPPSAGQPSAGPPKISLFFFPPPATFFILLSLGVLSLNFGGVFEGRNPGMCTFGLSGCRVKRRRPHQTGPPGLAHDSPRTPNVHISGPRRFKHHQNSTNGPQEKKEERKLWREYGKKSAKFWAPHPSGLHPSGPHFF